MKSLLSKLIEEKEDLDKVFTPHPEEVLDKKLKDTIAIELCTDDIIAIFDDVATEYGLKYEDMISNVGNKIYGWSGKGRKLEGKIKSDLIQNLSTYVEGKVVGNWMAELGIDDIEVQEENG
jgi:hypothetical protein